MTDHDHTQNEAERKARRRAEIDAAGARLLLNRRVEAEMKRLGPARDAIASQLELLKDDLWGIPGFGAKIQQCPDHLIDAGYSIATDTGVIWTWIVIGDYTYWRDPEGDLMLMREAAGGMEWTVVDKSTGELGRVVWSQPPGVVNN